MRLSIKSVIVSALLFASICLTGCFQSHSDDCNYRTVPTTNNPNNLPDQGARSTPF